jgi:hypothetical protein
VTDQVSDPRFSMPNVSGNGYDNTHAHPDY